MSAAASFLKKRRKKIIIIVVIIIVAVTVWKLLFSGSKGDDENQMPTELAQVTKQDISNYISVTGTIEAVKSQTVYSTINEVEVLSVDVEVGQTVSKNQIVATLDSSEYEDKLATAQKELDVQRAKTQIRVAKADENVDRTYVDAADGEKHAARNIDRAATDYGYSLGDVSDAYTDWQETIEDYEDAKDDYEKADHRYDKAKKAYDRLKEGSLSETISVEGEDVTFDATPESMERLRGIVDERKEKRNSAEKNRDSAEDAAQAAERKYYHAKESSEQTYRKYDDAVESYADDAEGHQRKIEDAGYDQQEAYLDASIAADQQEDQIKNYKKQIDKCSIKAPIDGVVTSVKMEAGDETGNDNNVICVIQDTSAFIVNGTVDEYDVSKIKEGMKAVIRTDATGDAEMEGVVLYVAPTPNSSGSSEKSTGSSSGTEYEVKISINELNPDARIGMTAATNIIIEEAEAVLAVPSEYVDQNMNGDYVIYSIDMSTVSDAVELAPELLSSISEVPVVKGLESEYYVQIDGNGLREGLDIISPSNVTYLRGNLLDAGADDDSGDGTGFGMRGGRRGGRPPF